MLREKPCGCGDTWKVVQSPCRIRPVTQTADSVPRMHVGKRHPEGSVARRLYLGLSFRRLYALPPFWASSCACTSLWGMTATAQPWPVAPHHHHQPWGSDKASTPWNSSDIGRRRTSRKRDGAEVLASSLACWRAEWWIPYPESPSDGEPAAWMTSTDLPASQEQTHWWMLPWPWPSESEDRQLGWPALWLCTRMLTEGGTPGWWAQVTWPGSRRPRSSPGPWRRKKVWGMPRSPGPRTEIQSTYSKAFLRSHQFYKFLQSTHDIPRTILDWVNGEVPALLDLTYYWERLSVSTRSNTSCQGEGSRIEYNAEK